MTNITPADVNAMLAGDSLLDALGKERLFRIAAEREAAELRKQIEAAAKPADAEPAKAAAKK